MPLNHIAIASLATLLGLTGCEALGGTCQEVEQQGPGLTGSATYVIGDGSRLELDLDNGGYARVMTNGIEIHGSFKDAWNRNRPFTLNVHTTTPGTYDLAGAGDVCIARQSNGASVCSPLTGTIELREHEEDCYFHSSGIGTCAETLDFTIAARSDWEGTVLTVDATMLTVGSWVEAECE